LKHGRTNASLPKDSDVQAVTMVSAMELLAKKTKGKKPTKGKKAAAVSVADEESDGEPVKKTKKPRKKAASKS
jgi:DNA topoisomerase-1